MPDIQIFSGKPVFLNQLNRAITATGFTKVFILTDNNTSVNCLPVLNELNSFKQIKEINLPLSEKNKNLSFIEEVWKALFKGEADRKSLILNLGGGVITDMGGFAASTFKRGINYLNIPTSLLAMVDAAIGGKTGINYNGIKNQIGTVYQPLAVYIYPGFLKTLPEKEFYSGLAEMIKQGLISDETYFWQVIDWKNHDIKELIEKSVQIKQSIVEKDPEETGLRKLLNFGHTIGHAIETYLNTNGFPVTHGHAVALGMIAESYLSARLTGLSSKNLQVIESKLTTLYDRKITKKINPEKILSLIKHDKKNYDGKVRFVLLEQPGKAVFNITVPESLIREAIKFLINY